MLRSLICAFALSLSLGGAALAAPTAYTFDLTVDADSGAFGGISFGDVFSGTVDLDPSLPTLANNDGSVSELLFDINGNIFDQNAAVSSNYLSASTNFASNPLPFFADDPNGFVDILIRDLTMGNGSALTLSTVTSNDIRWFANDAAGARLGGAFTIELAAPIPLPAGLPLLGGALLLVGVIRRTAGS